MNRIVNATFAAGLWALCYFAPANSFIAMGSGIAAFLATLNVLFA